MTKSINHTYSVGERVFDLPSQTMVTIQKITLMRQQHPYKEVEYIEYKTAKCITAEDLDAERYGDEDCFIINVNAPSDFPGVEDWPDGDRIFSEVCLPEEAEIYRDWQMMPSDEILREEGRIP